MLAWTLGEVATVIVFLSGLVLFQRDVHCLDEQAPLAPPPGGGRSPWAWPEDSWSYWWSYSGVSGPTYWGLLNLDWSICDKGRRQSPIDIETSALMYDPRLGPLRIDSNLISGLFYNDGHALVFNASASLVASYTADSIQIASRTQPNGTATSRRRRQVETDELVVAPVEVPKLDNPTLAADPLLKELQEGVRLSMSFQAGDTSLKSESPATAAAINSDQEQVAAGELNPPGESSTESLPAVQMSGAGLAYPYKFEALTLRFGPDDDKPGSEHQINSRAYAGELQLSAYNSQLYKSHWEAASRPHGLLGVSVLIELASGGHRHQEANNNNSQLEALLGRLAELRHRGSTALVAGLNLSSLLPETEHFITYDGSLTTPGCQESVIWLVLNRPLYITKSSLDSLRQLSADEQTSAPTGTLIAGNIRPLQATNGRPLRTNIRPSRGGQNSETCHQQPWTRYEYRSTTGGATTESSSSSR